MAILSIPDQGVQLHEPLQIKAFLADHGVFFEQWECPVYFDDTASQEEILEALRGVRDPQTGRNVVEAGMVQQLKIEGNEVNFSLAINPRSVSPIEFGDCFM